MVTLQRFNLMFAAIARIVHFFLFLGLLALAYFLTDRAPPFEMLRVYPAEAKAGEPITIYADVRRQLWRKCSAKMSRFVFDSINDRVDIGEMPIIAEHIGDTFFSAALIERMERETPGKVAIRFIVPPKSRPGVAALVSPLEYSCNVTHRLWPISITTVLPFTILPP